MINLFIITTLIIFTVAVYGKTMVDTTAAVQLFPMNTQSPLYLHGSSYYSVGNYSTSTVSKSLNTYISLEKPKQWFLTGSYLELTFSRDDMGDNYFNQYILLGKAGVWIDNRTNASAFYAYNFQSGIKYYTEDFIFKIYGGNANYWFNKSTAVGISYVGGTMTTREFDVSSLSMNKKTTEHSLDNTSIHFYYNIYKSLWSHSTGTLTYAKWAGQFFMFRENLSFNVTDYLRVNASAGIGRRAFYFDEDLLVMYNQPDVQTASYVVGASIGVTKKIHIIPSFQYDEFDDYIVRYGTVGVRVTF